MKSAEEEGGGGSGRLGGTRGDKGAWELGGTSADKGVLELSRTIRDSRHCELAYSMSSNIPIRTYGWGSTGRWRRLSHLVRLSGWLGFQKYCFWHVLRLRFHGGGMLNIWVSVGLWLIICGGHGMRLNGLWVHCDRDCQMAVEFLLHFTDGEEGATLCENHFHKNFPRGP